MRAVQAAHSAASGAANSNGKPQHEQAGWPRKVTPDQQAAHSAPPSSTVAPQPRQRGGSTVFSAWRASGEAQARSGAGPAMASGAGKLGEDQGAVACDLLHQPYLPGEIAVHRRLHLAGLGIALIG